MTADEHPAILANMFSQELLEAIDAAFAELTDSTMADIQRRTALTWAGRSLAAYEYFEATANVGALRDAVAWLHDAGEYAHEALEHAALHPDPSVLDELRPLLLSAARRAELHQIFMPREYGYAA
jgi:hypothetical protein